jgi:hypothetical protein
MREAAVVVGVPLVGELVAPCEFESCAIRSVAEEEAEVGEATGAADCDGGGGAVTRVDGKDPPPRSAVGRRLSQFTASLLPLRERPPPLLDFTPRRPSPRTAVTIRLLEAAKKRAARMAPAMARPRYLTT